MAKAEISKRHVDAKREQFFGYSVLLRQAVSRLLREEILNRVFMGE